MCLVCPLAFLSGLSICLPISVPSCPCVLAVCKPSCLTSHLSAGLNELVVWADGPNSSGRVVMQRQKDGDINGWMDSPGGGVWHFLSGSICSRYKRAHATRYTLSIWWCRRTRAGHMTDVCRTRVRMRSTERVRVGRKSACTYSHTMIYVYLYVHTCAYIYRWYIMWVILLILNPCPFRASVPVSMPVALVRY